MMKEGVVCEAAAQGQTHPQQHRGTRIHSSTRTNASTLRARHDPPPPHLCTRNTSSLPGENFGCVPFKRGCSRGWGRGLGFGVWGLGFGVWGLGFGVWGLGFGGWGLGFGAEGCVDVVFREYTQTLSVTLSPFYFLSNTRPFASNTCPFAGGTRAG